MPWDQRGRGAVEQMLMEPQEESLCCEAGLFVAGWAGVEVVAALHVAGTPARAQTGCPEGAGLCGPYPSWLQQPLYWAMGAAARESVPYFLLLPSSSYSSEVQFSWKLFIIESLNG